MYWLVALLSLSVLGVIGLGVYFQRHPLTQRLRSLRVLRWTVAANLVLMAVAGIGFLALGSQDVVGQSAATTGESAEISIGLGLALIGIGIPTGLATIGAGIAVSAVGASSLALIAERPEMFGRTLVYLGLAEGIAIYGLVVTILLLAKIP